jgi:hypothetical protein
MIENKHGDDRATIAMNINDRPDAPGRPTVQDVQFESARLQWQPPKNDGGSSIRHYIVEMSMYVYKYKYPIHNHSNL